jgi:dihydrofolate reductase
LDWHEYVWGEELEQLSLEQLKSADMLLFGRVTYQGMASHWPSATGEVADVMNGIPKVVFSRTLERAEWTNTRLVKADAQEEVATLKQQSGKDLFIFGSADLSSTLIRHGLIDEYRLGLTPVVLGSGKPLFKPGPDRLRMRLLEARPLKLGCVILRYEPYSEQ